MSYKQITVSCNSYCLQYYIVISTYLFLEEASCTEYFEIVKFRAASNKFSLDRVYICFYIYIYILGFLKISHFSLPGKPGKYNPFPGIPAISREIIY